LDPSVDRGTRDVEDAWGRAVELTPRRLDENARWVYRNGQCLALAVAIATRQGWPVVAHTMASSWDDHDEPVTHELRHAYAQAPDGTLIDIYGECDPDAIDLEDGELLTACTKLP
ncbi:hypothetical protein, partial [Pengzhenrongella sp.]|uniref:hypothetical protein n=1 Tax=Pengzhenrongella sp. TaxID=2888820 RepID=UPI002F95DFE9